MPATDINASGVKSSSENGMRPSDMLMSVKRVARRTIEEAVKRGRFFESEAYWEDRYRNGRNSGCGSYGKFAEFKSSVINEFVKYNNIETVIEFGCGDGSQLALADYKSYVGLDVSKTIVKHCIGKFYQDSSKSFFLYSPGAFRDNHHLFLCELGLSLDVIYHLVEDEVFERYMEDLFSCAKRFVIIYSSDDEHYEPAIHVRNRKFTLRVEKNKPEWMLIKTIPNIYSYHGDRRGGSWSDFFFYKKQDG
jgi:hypothetical protein